MKPTRVAFCSFAQTVFWHALLLPIRITTILHSRRSFPPFSHTFAGRSPFGSREIGRRYTLTIMAQIGQLVCEWLDWRLGKFA
jgi:hypothetical protein